MLIAIDELPGPRPDRQRPRESVRNQVEPGLDHPRSQRELLHGRLELRRLAGQQLAGSDHAQDDAVGVPVRAEADEQTAEAEHQRDSKTADPPAERPQRGAKTDQERPGFQDVAERRPGGSQRGS